MLLMERYEVTPKQNPFCFLCLANCVLYSVVCVFLLMKGWKKKGPMKTDKQQDRKGKLKRIYDQEEGKIRKQLSFAKAEIERLKENRKKRKGKIGLSSKENAKPSLWQVWLATSRKKSRSSES